MELGICVPLRRYATPEFIETLGTASERLGFDELWVGEHVVMFDDHGSDFPLTGERMPGDPDDNVEIDPDWLLLIGRRQTRSINSWGHNLEILTRGKPRCTLQVHPDDARGLRLAQGELAKLATSTGELEVPVEITSDIMPGVVSMPHGWGHDRAGTRMRIARQQPGTNLNRIVDETRLDALSGTAVLNGIPVQVVPAHDGGGETP